MPATSTPTTSCTSILTASRNTCRRASEPRPGAIADAAAREGDRQAAPGGARATQRRSSATSIADERAAVQRRARRAAQLRRCSTRCSASRRTGSRTGASRPKRSTTAASSTSTSWPPLRMEDPDGLRGGASLRVRAARTSGAVDRAARSITSTGCSTRATTCGGCRPRARAARRGAGDRPILRRRREDPRRRTSRCRTAGRSRHHGLRVRQRGQRPVRGPQRNERDASTTSTRASRATRQPTFDDLAYQKQEADHAGDDGRRDQRARPSLEPLLRAQPPLPRLHAEQPDRTPSARSSPASRSTAPTSPRARSRSAPRDRAVHRSRPCRRQSGAIPRDRGAGLRLRASDVLLKRADDIRRAGARRARPVRRRVPADRRGR